MSDDADALMEGIVAVVRPLLAALEVQFFIGRHLHPPAIPRLVAFIGDRDADLVRGLEQLNAAPWPAHLTSFRDQLAQAAEATLRGFQGLRAAVDDPNAIIAAYRALRHTATAQEALYPVASMLRPVSQFFLEPEGRVDAGLLDRLAHADPGRGNAGVLHADNEKGQRGGFSAYAPEYADPDVPMPVIFALHGGSGHGRGFLWSWIREARTRGILLISPTASGETWSLMEPDVDGSFLSRVLDFAGQTWNIDRSRVLLTGMSDGGTFSLLYGLSAGCPFTHLAPIAASFHPMMLGFMDPARVTATPIHLTHGALDWMFPVAMAREAETALKAAGSPVTYREIEDLSHTYPRDGNAGIMDWFLR